MVTIYKITNRLNNKTYVGQTRQPIEKRFLQHAKANSPLGDAMRTCGLENFTIEVIERCETQAQANERERFWIRVLNCRVPNGYNRSNGGEIGRGKKVKFTNEQMPMDFIQWSMFYNRIRSRREELGISQDELARRVGYKSRSSINKIEKGKNDITQSKIAEIAAALDTTPEYLMGWQNETKLVNAEEAEIVDGYRELNDEGKRLVVGMIRQLNFKHGGAIPHRQVAAV